MVICDICGLKNAIDHNDESEFNGCSYMKSRKKEFK